MARTPRTPRTPRIPRTLQTPAHRRNHKKTSPGMPPEPAALEDNDARIEAARQSAAAAAALQPRNNDGTFARVRPVVQVEPLREPRGDMSVSATSSLDWAFSGTDGDTPPVTLMQPFVHHLDELTTIGVNLEVTEFVDQVTPEVPRYGTNSARAKNPRAVKPRLTLGRVLLGLLLGVLLTLVVLMLGFVVYIKLTSPL